jgi:hypothetical protein
MDDYGIFPVATIDVDAISWGEQLPFRKKTIFEANSACVGNQTDDGASEYQNRPITDHSFRRCGD